MTLDPRRERIARNEAAFRDINERLEQGLRRVPHTPELLEFVCECGDRDCRALVQLTFAEYEAVRSFPQRFAVRRGHVFHEAERVVEDDERFQVVEKTGEAVRLVESLDPRKS